MDRIWDPIRKKQVTATPEERVRQWFVNVLHSSLGVPLGLMRTEVGFRLGGKRLRADIVVYDRSGEPLCIVECKQEGVELDAAVAAQALRYFSVLRAPYVILTNGKNNYIYRLEGGAFTAMDHIPAYEEMLCRQ